MYSILDSIRKANIFYSMLKMRRRSWSRSTKTTKLLFRVNLLSMIIRWSCRVKENISNYTLIETAVHKESLGKEALFVDSRIKNIITC